MLAPMGITGFSHSDYIEVKACGWLHDCVGGCDRAANAEIVPHEEHTAHQVQAGDTIEVVTLVGGG